MYSFNSASAYSLVPSVYVSTYAKYAEGNLDGAWLNLDDYYSFDEFISACRRLHADEAEPELMFQDFDGFPEEFYSECSLDEQTFENIRLFCDLSKCHGFKAVNAFVELGIDSLDRFNDYYLGSYDSKLTFAYEIAEQQFRLEALGDLARFFDYDAYADELFMTDFYFEDGFVFSACA